MEPLTAGLLVGGTLGSSLLGGLMGSKGSGDTEREAARRQIELGKNQSLINSQTMAPFIGYGQLAAQDLWGYGPSTGQGTTGGLSGATEGVRTTGGSASIPFLNSTGAKWDSPTTVGYNSYGKTGSGFDRTGGAGKYVTDLESLVKNFQFDSNDPGYRYKTEEADKSINKALASRGLFDSRAGVNMLADSNRAIMSDEYNQQYNRKYGGLTDLFNMSKGLGETGYQSLLDAVKVGTGAGSAAGQLGNQSAALTGSAYGQMAQAGQQNDANNASLWSGLGAMPMNAMLLYNMLQKQ